MDSAWVESRVFPHLGFLWAVVHKTVCLWISVLHTSTLVINFIKARYKHHATGAIIFVTSVRSIKARYNIWFKAMVSTVYQTRPLSDFIGIKSKMCYCGSQTSSNAIFVQSVCIMEYVSPSVNSFRLTFVWEGTERYQANLFWSASLRIPLHEAQTEFNTIFTSHWVLVNHKSWLLLRAQH